MTTKDTVADNRLKCVGLNFIEITSRRLSGHPHHTGSNSKLMETSMDRVYRIGAVGMGRMGMRHVRALAASDRWDLAYRKTVFRWAGHVTDTWSTLSSLILG